MIRIGSKSRRWGQASIRDATSGDGDIRCRLALVVVVTIVLVHAFLDVVAPQLFVHALLLLVPSYCTRHVATRTCTIRNASQQGIENPGNKDASQPLQRNKRQKCLELNKRILSCQDHTQILNVLRNLPGSSLSKYRGGDVMDHVNYSTVVHRLATQYANTRGVRRTIRLEIVADPTFSLLVASMAEHMVTTIGNWPGRNLANVAWAMSKLDFVRPSALLAQSTQAFFKDRAEATKVIERHSQELRAVILNNQQERISNGGGRVILLLNLCSLVMDLVSAEVLRRLTSRESNNTPPASATTTTTTSINVVFDHQNLSNLLWSSATVSRVHPPTFAAALRALMLQSNTTSNPQWISNPMWAVARSPIMYDDPIVDEFLTFLGEMFTNANAGNVVMRRFSEQQLSNLMWGVAKLSNVDADGGMRSRRRRHRAIKIVQSLSMFLVSVNEHQSITKPQHIANIAWSIATLGFGTDSDEDRGLREKMFVKLLHDTRYQSRLDKSYFGTWKGQEMSNLIWSISKAGVADSLDAVDSNLLSFIFDATAQQFTARPNNFNGQEIANIAWSFATVNYRHVALFHSMAEYIVNDPKAQFLINCNPQDLSNLAWSYATLSLRHDGLLYVLFSAFQKQLEVYLKESRRLWTLKEQGISNFVWALAVLGSSSVELKFFDLVAECTETLVQEFKGGTTTTDSNNNIERVFIPQGLSNLAWACAVFRCYPERLMNVIQDGLTTKACNDNSQMFLASLAWFLVARELEGPSPSRAFFVPESLLSQPVIISELRNSKLQKDVSSAMVRIGFQGVEEYVVTMKDLALKHHLQFPQISNGVFAIDLADPLQHVAIEVDGPSHFVAHLVSERLEEDADGLQWNGSTQLKHRLLTRLGWKVIHIPYYEWSALRSKSHLEDDYCRRKLSERAPT